MTRRPPVALAALLLLSAGCAARSYTHYLIEPEPALNDALVEEEGTQLRPMGFGSTTAMTVRWNDGDVLTEVQIPMLAAGQRIVIAHTEGATDVDTTGRLHGGVGRPRSGGTESVDARPAARASPAGADDGSSRPLTPR